MNPFPHMSAAKAAIVHTTHSQRKPNTKKTHTDVVERPLCAEDDLGHHVVCLGTRHDVHVPAVSAVAVWPELAIELHGGHVAGTLARVLWEFLLGVKQSLAVRRAASDSKNSVSKRKKQEKRRGRHQKSKKEEIWIDCLKNNW